MLQTNKRRFSVVTFPAAFLLAVCVQPVLAGTTVISFEESEGFPAAGGALEGMTTNGGLATWNTANLNGFTADSGPGDGFGFNSDPSPLSGSQIAVVDAIAGQIAQVIMELSEPKALDSFYYANRGGFPPRLEVEYFDAGGQSIGFNSYMAPYNPDDTQTDMGSYPTISPFNVCVETAGGRTSCGVGLDNNWQPKFSLIKPTEPFQGVGLSKVIFNSFQNPERFNGALNVGINHGSFQLEDIALSTPTTTFNPNNYLRISFEANEGFPDEGGHPAPVPYSTPGGLLLDSQVGSGGTLPHSAVGITGAGISGIIDNFSIADNAEVHALAIDHGPGCGYPDGQEGFCIPSGEPDPVHGTQMINITGLGNPYDESEPWDEDFTLEIDLNDDAALAPVSFWYSYRGNGGIQTVDIEYFDIAGNSLGIESWKGSPDGGVALGVDSNWRPQFDKIVIGEGTETALPAARGVALSKMIINSTHHIMAGGCGNFPGGEKVPCHASFAMDDLLFECTTGNCPDYPVTVSVECDFNGDAACNDVDIDLLAAAVRNSTSDSKFNVDGTGGDAPDNADFDFYITDSGFLSTGLGDHDLNKIINFNDFVKLSNNFGSSGTGWGQGNGNTDDVTNFNDFVRLSNNFGMNFAAGSDVPEPTTLAVLGLGGLALIRRCRNG